MPVKTKRKPKVKLHGKYYVDDYYGVPEITEFGKIEYAPDPVNNNLQTPYYNLIPYENGKPRDNVNYYENLSESHILDTINVFDTYNDALMYLANNVKEFKNEM